MEVTLGGNRLGSGAKNKEHLHGYGRSTHNLSKSFASSIGPGILYPAYCVPVMRGDNFKIDLSAAIRTIPTKGPLFGSFKLQVDMFQCPIRLYQGILHNNPLAIGLKMNQVKLPMLDVWTNAQTWDKDAGKFNNSCLLKYLGMSGLGRNANIQTGQLFGRDILAVPALAYYDIFKNYYANKQEENAYVLTQEKTPVNITVINSVNGKLVTQTSGIIPIEIENNTFDNSDFRISRLAIFDFEGSNLYESGIEFTAADGNVYTVEQLNQMGIVENVEYDSTREWMTVILNAQEFWRKTGAQDSPCTIQSTNMPNDQVEELHLVPFELANIDEMRYQILSHNRLGETFYIQQGRPSDIMPYSTLISQYDATGQTLNKSALNGLVVKTYQSDLFNNWINSEWIEGEDGVAELSKIAVTDGAVYVDSIIFGQKVYDMFNRIALAGNTYEDWQDVIWDKSQKRYIESPVYLGGYSDEVVFEEIIQTAPTEGQPLGTLGGRGRLMKGKNGHINVKIDEPSFLIAIVSLTPRVYYTQGNAWYLTDLKTIDDLHKPQLDGIGFQDLIGEQMAWFDTVIEPNTKNIMYRSAVGKVPAWINYRTDVDTAYGDFAGQSEEGGFMILSRDYERADGTGISDITTYIDPKKYNYAFAYTNIDAQNFWLQIDFKVSARRKMSTSLIPKA